MRQKISYARSKSNIVAKLDGSFKMPNASAAANVEVTELQQNIFNAPVPGSATAAPSSAAHGLPSKPPAGTERLRDAGTPESRGQKRGRDDEDEDEEEEDSDVAMEEDSDDE